jgi:transcriptional regulator with XRE-family HTH domain
MVHVDGYDTKGVARLALDAGVSRSEVSRLMRGITNPSYVIVERIHKAIERKARRRISIKEIVSERGNYKTVYVCDLMKCKGCLPAYAFNRENERLEEFKHLKPGRWTGNVVPVDRKRFVL